ncbi:DUF6612 family protein [Paenibacillus sp. PDC88]|uniref:DUF6612 family protein n=1 Tax=Paenibacillus sp. PDC88 TaxID=1884375 RepID=UPI0008966C60|nr:DUF6612 family protein [Paenibacillus sp. PDC88]SDW89582.1 hypothetical protein SAMN05518848_103317 [Paenibacillus sp. PDC88]
MKKWKCSMIGMILVLMLAACGAENESQEVTPTDEANTEATTGADNIEESTEAPAEETSAEIPTAEELLKQVSESSSSIESYSMDTNITQNITMAVDGQEQTQDVEMNMKQDMVLSPIAVYQEISTSLPAESGAQEIKQYITEDAIYSHVEGSWMKLPQESIGPLVEQFKSQGSAAEQYDQLNSIANEIEVTEEGDVYWLKANLSGDGVKGLAQEMIAQQGATDPQMAAMMEQMDIKSIDLSYSVNKETYYPADMTYNMEMSMEMEGQNVTILMAMDGSFSKYNELDKIDIPQEVLDAPAPQ